MAPRRPAIFQIGQSLGDYSVLQELGKGGFGHVYKVEHTITGRREAMKVLAAGEANATEQAERFLREIRLQASLSHPNIAVVHTAFWVNDDLALVCEFLEGQSLQEFLEQEQPPLSRALDILAQVLDALSYAHARGIIHRDISPANIFLTAGGTVKIIDFGLAKAATDLRLTREGSPIGAAHYMSPEQIRGAQDIDARTDIYSAGVVLYELVTGKKPFDGDNSFTIMKAHTEQAPPSPAAANPNIPEALSAIIQRAMAKKPEERFQSADAFLQAIRQAQTEPAQAGAHRSLRRPVLVAAIATLTILMGVLFASVNTGRLGGAQPLPGKSLALPPPPPPLTAGPPVSVPAAPASADSTKKIAVKSRPRQTLAPKVVESASNLTPAASDPQLEPAHAEETDSTEVAASTPPTAKPRNPVVKLGGAIKRLNPFQQKQRSTEPNNTGK